MVEVGLWIVGNIATEVLHCIGLQCQS